jgi:hypothetical protein
MELFAQRVYSSLGEEALKELLSDRQTTEPLTRSN